MKVKIYIIAVVSALIISNPLFAQQDASAEYTNVKKLTVDLGVALVNTASNLDTQGEAEIEDNTEAGEASNSVLVIPIFDFRYIVAETKTEFFVGTPLDGSDLSLALGVSQPVEDLGRFTLSFAPSVGNEVWKNPYLENTEREKTPENQLTTKFNWDRIMNLPLNLTYTHIHTDVEDDEIGALYDDLKRDGYTQSTQLTVDIGLSKTSMISPGVLLKKGQIEGAASSYDKAGLSINYKKFDSNYLLILDLSANTATYRDEHPIYNKTRRDKEVGAFVMLRLLNLLDVENMHSNIVVGAGMSDSNLDFFDSNISYLAVTLGYSY